MRRTVLALSALALSNVGRTCGSLTSTSATSPHRRHRKYAACSTARCGFNSRGPLWFAELTPNSQNSRPQCYLPNPLVSQTSFWPHQNAAARGSGGNNTACRVPRVLPHHTSRKFIRLSGVCTCSPPSRDELRALLEEHYGQAHRRSDLDACACLASKGVLLRLAHVQNFPTQTAGASSVPSTTPLQAQTRKT